MTSSFSALDFGSSGIQTMAAHDPDEIDRDSSEPHSASSTEQESKTPPNLSAAAPSKRKTPSQDDSFQNVQNLLMAFLGDSSSDEADEPIDGSHSNRSTKRVKPTSRPEQKLVIDTFISNLHYVDMQNQFGSIAVSGAAPVVPVPAASPPSASASPLQSSSEPHDAEMSTDHASISSSEIIQHSTPQRTIFRPRKSHDQSPSQVQSSVGCENAQQQSRFASIQPLLFSSSAMQSFSPAPASSSKEPRSGSLVPAALDSSSCACRETAGQAPNSAGNMGPKPSGQCCSSPSSSSNQAPHPPHQPPAELYTSSRRGVASPPASQGSSASSRLPQNSTSDSSSSGSLVSE